MLCCPDCHAELRPGEKKCKSCGCDLRAAERNSENRSMPHMPSLAEQMRGIAGEYLPEEEKRPEPVREPSAHPYAAQMYEALYNRVVTIHIDGSTGTGFFLPNGMIGTNAHVVMVDKNHVAARVTVRHMGKQYAAKVVKIDPGQDAAVVDFTEGRPENLSSYCNVMGDSHVLKPGDEVISIGNSLGYGLIFNKFGIKDRVKYRPRFGNYRELILMNGTSQHGNSGGPLYNVEGKVVGMLTGSPVTAENVVFETDEGTVAGRLHSPEPGVCIGVTAETLMMLLGT